MVKAERADINVSESVTEIEVKPDALLDFSTQKLNEYVELIQLKQQHPEFESDINAQLLSFTKDNELIFNYDNGFTISNIEQIGKPERASDSVEIFTLKFTVETNSRTFKDSILTRVTSHSDYLQSVEAVTLKKVRFSRFR